MLRNQPPDFAAMKWDARAIGWVGWSFHEREDNFLPGLFFFDEDESAGSWSFFAN